ncbi:MAG: ABC transporter ATP-binding protein [Thermoanaerobaculia bacterium]|nr:ABC transporter ATP-binding protein [Thermoanaerobaculia bacterium]
MSETAAVSGRGRAAEAGATPVLDVRNLRVTFDTDDGRVRAVDGASFSIAKGEALALVGESGCGKSVTALSILRLLSRPGRIEGGEIRYRGRDLLSLDESEMRGFRGNRIAMIFQEPMTSLNPVMKIGDQVGEPLRIHRGASRAEARARAVELLDLVSIPDAASRVDDYPHQLSGGMRQRVMIAMALACEPELLIADEPTTALDVTIQAGILELLASLRERLGLSILLITHNLGIVAEFCERAVVMYTGRIVEEAPVEQLFRDPKHPYTRGLLASLPRLSSGASRLSTIPGVVPDIRRLPAGCAFAPRCGDVMEQCHAAVPALMQTGGESRARCFLYGDARETLRETPREPESSE